MAVVLRKYFFTAVALGVLGISFAVLIVGAAGDHPTGTLWRAVVIPAYVPVAVSAVISNLAGVLGHALLLPVGIGLTLLPFAVADWLRTTRRRSL